MVGGPFLIHYKMKHIKRTIYKSDGEMYDTPAAIDRETATLYINPKLWFQLTPFQRAFVRLHEIGHLVLDTNNEEMADAYAFDRLVGSEHRSMKQMIETLETILDPNKTGHRIRIEALYKKALAWDKAHPIQLNKGSGSSAPATSTGADYAAVINAAGKQTTDALTVVVGKEQNADNNRTMVYMMLAVAALFLLK